MGKGKSQYFQESGKTKGYFNRGKDIEPFNTFGKGSFTQAFKGKGKGKSKKGRAPSVPPAGLAPDGAPGSARPRPSYANPPPDLAPNEEWV